MPNVIIGSNGLAAHLIAGDYGGTIGAASTSKVDSHSYASSAPMRMATVAFRVGSRYRRARFRERGDLAGGNAESVVYEVVDSNPSVTESAQISIFVLE